MKKIRMFFQHNFNPLHVFCRLKEAGVSTIVARKMSMVYEKLLYKMFMF